jgi:hypothetical protein
VRTDKYIPIMGLGCLTGRQRVSGWRAAKRGDFGEIRQCKRRQCVLLSAIEAVLGKTFTADEIAAAIAYQPPRPIPKRIVIEHVHRHEHVRKPRPFAEYKGVKS